MITVPFDKEIAKKIQAGEYPGKIITRNGRDVKIVYWDMKNDYPIIAILKNNDDTECGKLYTDTGNYYVDVENHRDDLQLLVPEYAQFKEGDIVVCDIDTGTCGCYKKLFILKDITNITSKSIDFNVHASMDDSFNSKISYDGKYAGIPSLRLATDAEKNQISCQLLGEHTTKARNILKHFFGIEDKSEFKFLQPVLVRNTKYCTWVYGEFACKDGDYFRVNGGGIFPKCVPYTAETKYLLGTTEEFKGD